MDAPERIWATGTKTSGTWNAEKQNPTWAPPQTEYVRADLARPKVKALTEEDREWIDAEADRLFRESERRRGGVRPATITPQEYRDYFVVEATHRRILAALEE